MTGDARTRFKTAQDKCESTAAEDEEASLAGRDVDSI